MRLKSLRWQLVRLFYWRAGKLREKAQASGNHNYFRGSKRWLNLVTLIDPNIVQAYACRADCYQALEDYDTARVECEKGLQIDPDDAECKNRLAGFCWKAGEKDRAVTLRAEIVRSHPTDIDAWFSYGMTCGYADKYDLAVDCFKKVLAFDFLSPKQRAAANHNLGLYLGIQGKRGFPEKFEEALMAIRESERADPTWDGHKRKQMISELQNRLKRQNTNDRRDSKN